MKNFELIPIDREEFVLVILPTSYYEPLSNISDLVEFLKDSYKSPMRLMFDFIISSGNTNERFAEAFFNGEGIVAESFRSVLVPKDAMVRKTVSDFLKTRNYYLTSSVLNSVQKNLITKGFVI